MIVSRVQFEWLMISRDLGRLPATIVYKCSPKLFYRIETALSNFSWDGMISATLGPSTLDFIHHVLIGCNCAPGTSWTAKSLAGDVGRGIPARQALRTARSVVKDFGKGHCSVLDGLSKASEKKSDPGLS